MRFLLFCGVLLSGAACSVPQNFALRAVNYNRQAAQARDQAIVLNILRTAFQRPLQFTQLQSITGTDSITTDIGFTIPFGLDAASKAYSFNPSVTGTSGPTYSVAVLVACGVVPGWSFLRF
jgi:hypothetical protein